ncbi:hypothetical protein JZ751_026248 [Albula glossodonta]|uniref:Uncharacterized protein n=1 Tax=Albula glossodonta TaxID=121402 RepID=A0A8T2PBI5_9TELE|nr:hypothetical protein JZ751_026248 [Albula glossodonta]
MLRSPMASRNNHAYDLTSMPSCVASTATLASSSGSASASRRARAPRAWPMFPRQTRATSSRRFFTHIRAMFSHTASLQGRWERGMMRNKCQGNYLGNTDVDCLLKSGNRKFPESLGALGQAGNSRKPTEHGRSKEIAAHQSTEGAQGLTAQEHLQLTQPNLRCLTEGSAFFSSTLCEERENKKKIKTLRGREKEQHPPLLCATTQPTEPAERQPANEREREREGRRGSQSSRGSWCD